MQNKNWFKAFQNLFICQAVWLSFAPTVCFSSAYHYSPMNKVDPFSPLPLFRPSIKGTTRLQDYELSDLKLIGTLMGAEVSALIKVENPTEGILAKIGDKIGKKGGTIIAISRNKLVVSEPVPSRIPGGRTTTTETILTLFKVEKKPEVKDKNGKDVTDIPDILREFQMKQKSSSADVPTKPTEPAGGALQ